MRRPALPGDGRTSSRMCFIERATTVKVKSASPITLSALITAGSALSVSMKRS